jgi:hypothetical protein
MIGDDKQLLASLVVVVVVVVCVCVCVCVVCMCSAQGCRVAVGNIAKRRMLAAGWSQHASHEATRAGLQAPRLLT